jgi:putative ABC transport system permease protein
VPDGLPRVESIRVDSTVILVVIGLTIVTSMLAALGPALLSARIDLAPELRSSGRGIISAGTKGVRRALVVAQVALAVTVVAGAGVLLRTVLRLQSVDVGVAVDQLVVVFLEMPKAISFCLTEESRYAVRPRTVQHRKPQVTFVLGRRNTV